VNRSESPGRNGKSTPDSMKIISEIPARAHGPRAGSRDSGSKSRNPPVAAGRAEARREAEVTGGL